MSKFNIILNSISKYGRENILSHGKEYRFVKIAEKVNDSNFLIMIKSIRDGSKLVVRIEKDKDFIVKFNK